MSRLVYMMIVFAVVLSVFITAETATAETLSWRDIPYTDAKIERQMLDVYSPGVDKKHPVVVWLHGGGWAFGNKSSIQEKPAMMVDHGYAFVSVNYRFVPDATVEQIASDVAKAIRWVHDNGAKYGIDNKRIFVAGHSAGAHLSALVCTDGKYLKAAGMSLADIKGCIPVDTAVYDVKRHMDGPPPLMFLYINAFTTDEKTQRQLSPITHVAKEKGIPPFLLLHVASRVDSTVQAKDFAKKLREAGIPVSVFGAENKTHGTINRELGNTGDAATAEFLKFLDKTCEE